MGARGLAILCVGLAMGCVGTTDTDQQANLQGMVGTELNLLPFDFASAGNSTGLATAGAFRYSGLTNLCNADSSGSRTVNDAGVPKALVLTFPTGRCSLGPIITSTLDGEIRIEDLGGPFAARVTHTRLRHALSATLGGVQNTLDGIVELRASDANSIQVSQHSVERQVTTGTGQNLTLTRIRNLTAVISDTGGHANSGHLIVPTDIRVAGSVDLVYGGAHAESLHVEISTLVPLAWGGFGCLGTFRTGRLHAVVTGTRRGVVDVPYGCS